MREESNPAADDRGTLVIVGGHENKEWHEEILSTFVSLSKGNEANLVVMTTASQKPDKVGAKYAEALQKLTGTDASIAVCDGRDGDLEQVAKCIAQATGVFFVGGEPCRLLGALKGTVVEEVLHKSNSEGLVIAGTSAGALMMGDVVFMDGENRTNPSEDTMKPGPGMSLIRQVLLDVHFAERGRCGEMLCAIAKFPDHLGIGIDENTAVIYRGGCCRVIGSGAVFLFDPSHPDFHDHTNGTDDLALVGVRLHVLPKGFEFRIEDGSAVDIRGVSAQ
ncbi:cyanophycinase [Aeoliella sp. SH292]|uniref:cyanophycinase n=1 Tax=Aeoliella sp. SH292 TaxID=3454464 RepID=UPI003F956473